MKKLWIVFIFTLVVCISNNETFAKSDLVPTPKKGQIIKPSAESMFNCNINWTKGKTVDSVAKAVHKDFKEWSNATGYFVNTGYGTQWITFSAGYKGANASVTVGSSNSNGRYFAAKYPKGKKQSRLWNNHPGKLTVYTHEFCGKKYTFSRSSINYFIEYR